MWGERNQSQNIAAFDVFGWSQWNNGRKLFNYKRPGSPDRSARNYGFGFYYRTLTFLCKNILNNRVDYEPN